MSDNDIDGRDKIRDIEDRVMKITQFGIGSVSVGINRSYGGG